MAIMSHKRKSLKLDIKISYSLLKLGEVSRAKIKQIIKLASNTMLQTSMAKLAPPQQIMKNHAKLLF